MKKFKRGQMVKVKYGKSIFVGKYQRFEPDNEKWCHAVLFPSYSETASTNVELEPLMFADNEVFK